MVPTARRTPSGGGADRPDQQLLVAAHELRGPLGVAAGYLDVVAEGGFGELPERAREPVRIARDKLREADGLIETLLLRGRGARPRGRTVDARELVAAALRRARPRADLAHAKLASDVPECAVPVAADALQIGRVLDNLINNALIHAETSPQVHIELSDGEEMAEIRVADSGVGIAPAQRRRIFRRFARVAEPEGGTEGTGLGLAIARQMAEANGGSLELEASRPGRGSRFLLRLPRAAPSRAG